MRRRPATRSRLAAALALAVPLAGCVIERPAKRTDTLRIADTVVQVDTVIHVDTLRGLGPESLGAPGAVAALPDSGDGGTGRGPNWSGPPFGDGPGGARTATAAGEVAPTGAGAAARPALTDGDRARLRALRPAVPVRGVRVADLRDTFGERRGGGRAHEALDIPAARGTPVVAAAEGRVLKLFQSDDGGRTVYVLDPGGTIVHYYAHLDAYAPGLAEGRAVRQGDALGTVGTTGNASPQTPHLHYAIARIPDSARWWAGTPVNPYPLLTGKATIEEGGAVPATQAAAPDSARRAPGRARTPEPTTPAARAREAREASRRGG